MCMCEWPVGRLASWPDAGMGGAYACVCGSGQLACWPVGQMQVWEELRYVYV
jgi:hypothetical protein